MQKITYEFNDSSTQTIEVTNEFYEQYQKLVQQEKRNTKRETRRHISLDYLNDKGIDFADSMVDLDWLSTMAKSIPNLSQAIAQLSVKQQQLLKQIYYDKISLRSIAKLTGVSPSALSQRLATIYRKLQEILEQKP
ncbi:MAG: hypothetical protein NC133_02615 [Prevotella sp.]|nr:hypothetical protein [Prevotella sp.]